MKKYEILTTFDGANDGFTVKTFEKGKVYPLSDDLALAASKSGWVKPVAEGKAEKEGTKAAAAPGNKAKNAPKNKGKAAPAEPAEGENAEGQEGTKAAE